MSTSGVCFTANATLPLGCGNRRGREHGGIGLKTYTVPVFHNEAERWLDKPVISINVATYWHALRENGITDRLQGFTRLLSEF